jgi:DNA-binding CsgD family transcriptional regulator
LDNDHQILGAQLMASGHVHSPRTTRNKRLRRRGPDAAAFTPIVGRGTELGVLRDQLGDPSVRLLTMTGPAGVGKTRLVLALADALGEPPGPPVLLDMAGQDGMDAVLATPPARPGEPDRLLVVDQGEHVTEALAAGLPRLLTERPGTRVLLVSREPLHLYGERVLRVPPLARPASLELFRQRAMAVRPGFSPSAGDRAVLDELCGLLDDLPLAIEFAAARLKLFQPAELVERLREGQDVLYGGPTLSHHASMREAIGWSYDRLTPAEQAAFRALAAREGAFSLREADAYEPEVIETLVDKNLLVPLDPDGNEPRLRMLRPVRAFARGLDTPRRPDPALAARMWAPGAPGGGPRPAQPLTPREQEVATLVAQGLTNRQIAGRLGIAEWTAVNHVRNVMRKLDCSSRVNVASWVLRDGAIATATD